MVFLWSSTTETLHLFYQLRPHFFTTKAHCDLQRHRAILLHDGNWEVRGLFEKHAQSKAFESQHPSSTPTQSQLYSNFILMFSFVLTTRIPGHSKSSLARQAVNNNTDHHASSTLMLEHATWLAAAVNATRTRRDKSAAATEYEGCRVRW